MATPATPGARDWAAELGLRPLARIHTVAMAGVDPIIMLTGPIPALLDARGESEHPRRVLRHRVFFRTHRDVP